MSQSDGVLVERRSPQGATRTNDLEELVAVETTRLPMTVVTIGTAPVEDLAVDQDAVGAPSRTVVRVVDEAIRAQVLTTVRIAVNAVEVENQRRVQSTG